MDAHALLTSQGWRGSGHSLHPTNDSTGLSRPLLVSQKKNTLGVGKKQHKTSDMWWMNAFDKSLKSLDTSKEGTVVQTVTNGGLDMVVKGGAKFVGNGGGLYASFVRGECLSGTITPEERNEEPTAKRRREDDFGKETKEERRVRKAAKRALKAKETAAEEAKQVEEEELERVNEVDTKEQQRERKQRKKFLQQTERDAAGISSENAKRKKRRKK